MQITIGTRASKLAMVQTRWIVQRLHQQWPNLEIVIEQIHTTGDRVTNVPITRIGSDGVFVNEIEQALRERRIDLAVHSLKDLPTAQPAGLKVVVTGPREDPRDVLVSCLPFPIADNDENEIIEEEGKMGAVWVGMREIARSVGKSEGVVRLGTCSLRRTAQIRALWPEAEILPLRGNVDTRLRKLEAGEYDGIIVASAGLHRLDFQERLSGRLNYFPLDVILPAPAQGALGLECRDEPELLELLAPLQDLRVQAATTAERSFMRRLGVGCYLPVAAYGEIVQETLTVSGLVISLDGQRHIRVRQSMRWLASSRLADAEALGERLAEEALRAGAEEIIAGLLPQEANGEAHSHV